ncbi:hypothetical protein CP972_26725 [Streptomyces prasinus]|uniref:Uncharacterized protein n=1 Tax=Streptomyces prasinus TaxID=67345 RepID=A0ABX6B3T6_9ACTN|nr:hypothetical protein CP972_26725 [Streptomyces prasinus]
MERLEHLRGAAARRQDGALSKLLLFAGSGFTGDLRREADRRGDVEPTRAHLTGRSAGWAGP